MDDVLVKNLLDNPENKDAETWEAFLNGNSQAFRSIYDQYADTLFAYGKKLTPETFAIEDCIQDLFVDLWNSRRKLSKVNSIKAYLFVSFRRKLLLRLKKQRNFYSLSQADNIPEDDPSPENDHLEKLTALLDSMPERQREVVFLRFYNGLSCSEIAMVLGVKTQSVYNLIHRAVTLLRDSSLTLVLGLLHVVSNLL